MENHSPVILKKQINGMMTFSEAMYQVIVGKKITRLEWNDKNEYGMLKEGWLQIYTKGQFHIWKISDGDMLNSDWVVINPETLKDN